MAKRRFIVVVGASAGGSVALTEFFDSLTPDLKHTIFTCKIPHHREKIKTGHIYVAPPDNHMMVKIVGFNPVV
ncbi:hypothetical protein [Ohtaekwangia koreensis]|uniref:CheB methylesterase n=1 Tax=Ohtaekwangia koreensis TaxID=688867 RepID=A0A1T5M7A1_9BACT|nr:hypothetical protein [Ohtaekwangia koreensis]SKC83739.1 CheB methylesterase [Ohtaekwangia koreensis]